MENAGTLKINLNEKKQGYSNRMRLSMRKFKVNGRKMKPSECSFLSKVDTFSTEEKACLLTYDQIEEEFGYHHSTTAEAIEELIKNGIIEVVGRTKEGTAYKLAIKFKGKYIIIPQFLYTSQILVEGKYRPLKGSEIIVLAYLMHVYKAKETSETIREKWAKGWSFRELARDLCYNEKTIRIAIHALMKAKLIFRPKEDKGVNGRKKSRYIVEKKLYEYEKKRKQSKKKKVSQDVSAWDKRAEWESYYANLRQAAENRADKYTSWANRNEEFRKISRELRMIELSLAKAELFNPAHLVVYTTKKKKLQERRAELLRAMNIKEMDLIPQYRCKKCEDSGIMKYGDGKGYMCDCYKRE